MATSQDDQERAHPMFLQVDRCVLDLGMSENKKERLDSDFSMSTDRLAFLRAETMEECRGDTAAGSSLDEVLCPLLYTFYLLRLAWLWFLAWIDPSSKRLLNQSAP